MGTNKIRQTIGDIATGILTAGAVLYGTVSAELQEFNPAKWDSTAYQQSRQEQAIDELYRNWHTIPKETECVTETEFIRHQATDILHKQGEKLKRGHGLPEYNAYTTLLDTLNNE